MSLSYRFLKVHLTFFILIGIFLLALFLRTYLLNVSPPGFTWDEASWGYNAYSILKTGRDEYGTFMPLIFKAFGDYKFGTYIYLDVPFIALFGLTETATRLPAIIAGSLIPILVALIVRQLLPSKKYLGFVVGFLISISPWAMQYSRGAWEASVALLEALVGFLFLLKAREGSRKYLFLGVVFFSLTIYTYQSFKILSTLVLVGSLLVFKDEFLKKKVILKTILIVSIFFLILVSSFLDKQALSRLVVLNQLSYHRSESEIAKIKQEESRFDPTEFELFHTEAVEYLRTVSGRYLNYFSPHYLFIQGGADARQGAIGYGMMHFFELPFLFLGVVFLMRLPKKSFIPIVLWAAAAPIAAATSRDLVNTDRTLSLLVPLEIISGLGLYEFIRFFKKRRSFLVLTLIVLSIVVLFAIGYYFDRLFIHTRIHGSQDFLYGHKLVVDYIEKNKDKYNKIYFTTKYNEPYIFYLFYSKYDPTKFQQQAVLIQNSPDVGEVPRIDNIEFRPLYWPNDRSEKNNLYIGTWLELPDQDIDPKQSKLLETIYFLDHTIGFKIVETKP